MDNKSQDFAQWDNKLLSKEFEKLANIDFDLNMTGFGLDEIAKLNEKMLEFDSPEDVNEIAFDINENFEVPETNVKSFMLLYDLKQLEKFKGMLDVLKEKYNIENYSDIVFEAVKNESNT